MLGALVRETDVLNADGTVLTGWQADGELGARAAVGQFDEVDDAPRDREHTVLERRPRHPQIERPFIALRHGLGHRDTWAPGREVPRKLQGELRLSSPGDAGEDDEALGQEAQHKRRYQRFRDSESRRRDGLIEILWRAGGSRVLG